MNRKLRAMALAAGLCVYASPALAQTKEEADQTGDIVVTAQKRAQSINDVGQTLVAIGSEDLKQQRIFD